MTAFKCIELSIVSRIYQVEEHITPVIQYFQCLCVTAILVYYTLHIHVAAVGAVDVLATPETVVDMVTVHVYDLQQRSGLQWVLGSELIEFSPLDINTSNQAEPNRNAIVNGMTFNAVLTEVVPVGSSGFYNLTSNLTTTASEEIDGIMIRCRDT